MKPPDVPSGQLDGEGKEHALTPRELTEIIRAFAGSDLRELRLVVGDVDLLVSRNDVVEPVRPSTSAPRQVQPPPASTQAAADVAAPGRVPQPADGPPVAGAELTGLVPVQSPAVGMFYRRPAPDEQPYVEVGSTVSAGDPVGTMEVMKMFTTVRAEASGTVADICVADATLVEYHQVLMYLTPSAAPTGTA